MSNLPGIILIDDTKEDLDSIQNSLVSAGYPCFPIHYDNNDPNNVSGIDHINLERIHPRVIITDLNLQELQVDAKKLVAPIANVLEKIAIEGPYLLYFWSKNASTVKDVMNLIEERYSNIPYPIHWGILDKTKFMSRPSDLKDKVIKLFSDNPIFSALFGWENRVSSAAQETTDSLFKLASPQRTATLDEFQNETTSNLETMLALIGNETIGTKNAKEEPEGAIELGLSPILQDHINSIWNKDDSVVWHKAVPSIGTEVSLGREILTRLNSFCHVEEVDSHYSKGCRGVFLELAADIQSDPKKREKIESRLGTTLDNLIDEEFLVQIVKEEKRPLVRNETKIGFVEISAECDQAQKKTKLHRYVIAALTPLKYTLEDEKQTPFDLFGKHNKKSHNGIYRVPDINLGGVDYMLQLSFKYQIGSLPLENSWLGDSLLRLRDQIMVDISFNCAQYISRPGIIAFK